ncbi:MAG: hypothetical protein ACE5GS_15175 [Kiloniellaceae bacterium]
MTPFEIIATPFTLYWAPVAEPFPLIDAAPAGNWSQIGTSGNRNYSDEGVTVAHGQSVELFRPVGSTGPVKASRTEESLIIRVTLWDLLLEQYRLLLNNNVVATTAAASGTAGFKEVPIYQGLSVNTLALLVRGDVSPEGAGWKSQYEVPVCFQSGSPEPVFAKGAPAGLTLEFTALEDPNAATASARFGRLVVQHQAPLP